MPGLLDFLSSPDAQFGLGLLGAAAPRAGGVNFGQGLQEALGYVDKQRQMKAAELAQAQAMKLQEMQMSNYQSEIEARKLAGIKDARQQKMMESFFPGIGGEQPSPTAQGVATGGAPSPMPGAAQGGNDILGISQKLGIPAQAIQADMVFNGGKKISEMIASRSEPKWQNINGNLVNTSAQGFTGGMQAGMNASANGQVTAWQPDGRGGLVVGAPAGAVDTFSAYKMAEGGAKPMKVFNPQSQRDEYVTEADVVKNAGGMDLSVPGRGLDLSRVSPDQLAMLRQQDPAALQLGIDRFNRMSAGESGGPLAAGPSAAELAQNEAGKTRAVDTAKADVVRDTAKASESKLYSKLGSAIGDAQNLLKDGPTASGIGAGIDAGLGVFGLSTKGADKAAKLDTISGWMTSNVPRMEGPQSNFDIKNYQVMAGDVGNRMKPISQRLSALEGLNSLREKYAHLNGGGDSAASSDKPASNLMPTLPTANASNKGKKIRDTTTGEVLVSNGMSWVKE